MEFDLFYNRRIMGKVTLIPQGLYYRVCCRCSLPEDGVFRVVICSGNQTANLGICVPIDGQFGINTTIPKKHISTDNCTMELLKKDETTNSFPKALDPAKPFKDLQMLEYAVYDQETGVLSVPST